MGLVWPLGSPMNIRSDVVWAGLFRGREIAVQPVGFHHRLAALFGSPVAAAARRPQGDAIAGLEVQAVDLGLVFRLEPLAILDEVMVGRLARLAARSAVRARAAAVADQRQVGR